MLGGTARDFYPPGSHMKRRHLRDQSSSGGDRGVRRRRQDRGAGHRIERGRAGRAHASPSSRRGRRTRSGRASAPAPSRRARELGATIIWRGPLREDDRDSQVSEVEGFVSRGVSGIVLAPLDEAALVQPVSEAVSRKIPVVIFDSGLKGDDYVSFVATDNLKGGRLGGERLAQSLDGKGKVILLRYAEGHDSTGKREQGFLDAMKANPGIEVVSSNQYGGADVEGRLQEARVAAEHATRSRTARSAIDGIFTPNESGRRSRCCACCRTTAGRAR